MCVYFCSILDLRHDLWRIRIQARYRVTVSRIHLVVVRVASHLNGRASSTEAHAHAVIKGFTPRGRWDLVAPSHFVSHILADHDNDAKEVAENDKETDHRNVPEYQYRDKAEQNLVERQGCFVS